MVRWAAREPAWARGVPRAEMKIEGVGLMDVRDCTQVEVSGLTTGFSVAVDGIGRARRAIALTIGWEGCARRAERIWEPFDTAVSVKSAD